MLVQPFSPSIISCLLQILLKPIVAQLVMDPPASLDESMNIPSVKEVDDLLVVCIGQMAVTAGSDLLWKPLNHEVIFMSYIPNFSFDLRNACIQVSSGTTVTLQLCRM